MTRYVSPDEIMDAVHDSMMRPFKWGEADCFMAAADVLRRVHGVDPMAEFRGRYSTEQEAYAVLDELGGFSAAVASQARKVGLRPIEGAGRPGDIGETAEGVGGPGKRALAVCVGGAWAVKTLRGMALVRSVDRAWRL